MSGFTSSFTFDTTLIIRKLHISSGIINSFPSFIVVTIVATILSITLLTLFTFSIRAKIFPGKKPEIFHERATDDKFVMVLDKDSLGEKAVEVDSIIKEHGQIE